ncbi:uncharacterized protein LOC133185680 [Saccostrea echinata]|uniref:uncharacterized protein LOC133185680 n=1 Tax=Saccostrea echinata TaxID=191078 RepID=UPI002A83565A|nr:uncharacterized protein LOC133185680 [Saccostrea echinata]
MYKGLKSISHTLTRVCNCTNATGEWKISCNYGTHKDCKFNTGKQFFCVLNQEGSRRRKRDLTYLYSKAIAEETFNFGPLNARRRKRQTVMSFMEAKNVCLTAFEKSVPFRNCKKYVSSLGNSSLSSCISDLRFTGDASFTAIHVEVALEQCSTFIVLNSTFQEVEKDITHQIQSLCPSNCSGNGVCNKGNCTCNPRYAGSDCSFDLLGPPTITLISNFGFCDKSEEDCDEITLYGRYFLENMNTRCYTTRRRITENGSSVMLDYFEKNLEERTLFEGYCPLEYATTPTWVTFFTFNVSNDGRHFTENYNVYTYQSLCQEFHNDSGKISFTFKDGYCFVDGRCIANGKSNPKNECDICNVAKDKYSWTFNEGHCYIKGRCIADGEVNLANLCEVCNTSKSLTSWSISSDFCFINNTCNFDGENRENKECEICNIIKNRHGWTFTEDEFCVINGSCVRKDEHAAEQECKVCNPALKINDWSFDSGCSITPKRTSTEFTTSESTIATTESFISTTANESTKSQKITTELTKSSETPVSTASSETSTTEIKLPTTKTTTQPLTTKAPTDVKKETTEIGLKPTTTKEPMKKKTTKIEIEPTTTKAPMNKEPKDTTVEIKTTKAPIEKTTRNTEREPASTKELMNNETKKTTVEPKTTKEPMKETTKTEIEHTTTKASMKKTTTMKETKKETTETIVGTTSRHAQIKKETAKKEVYQTITKAPTIESTKITNAPMKKETIKAEIEPTTNASMNKETVRTVVEPKTTKAPMKKETIKTTSHISKGFSRQTNFTEVLTSFSTCKNFKFIL